MLCDESGDGDSLLADFSHDGGGAEYGDWSSVSSDTFLGGGINVAGSDHSLGNECRVTSGVEEAKPGSMADSDL